MNLRKRPAGYPDRWSTASSWAEYVQRHLDILGWDKATLSHKAKIDRSLISRWINDGNQPNVPSIRAVARAFGRDIREALVAAEIFTEQEMQHPASSAPDLRLLSDDELLHEVRRRMRRRYGSQAAAEGGDAVVTEVGEQDADLINDVIETYEDGADEGLFREPKSPPNAVYRRGQQSQGEEGISPRS